MAEGLKLPRIRAGDPITGKDGRAVSAFVIFWEKVMGRVERQEATQDSLLQQLQDVQSLQAQEILRLNAVVFANQQAAAAAQAAAQAANGAQQTADEALANGTVSGSGLDYSMFVSGGAWTPGPLVNLTSVLAGNLTIPGTGPVQDLDVTLTNVPGVFSGEYRVVEVVGGVDTVVAGPFAFSAFQSLSDTTATVSNDDLGAVEAFTAARSSTGAVSYRVDVRELSSVGINDLSFYLYARRAP